MVVPELNPVTCRDGDESESREENGDGTNGGRKSWVMGRGEQGE